MLIFLIQASNMNKKNFATALIPGPGVVYCIRLLMGRDKPAKMDAPGKIKIQMRKIIWLFIP